MWLWGCEGQERWMKRERTRRRGLLPFSFCVFGADETEHLLVWSWVVISYGFFSFF